MAFLRALKSRRTQGLGGLIGGTLAEHFVTRKEPRFDTRRFLVLVARGLIACSSAYAAAERRRRVGAAGARKGPRGVRPGDRWPHEILPSGPWKGPVGALPGDRWMIPTRASAHPRPRQRRLGRVV